MKNSLRFLAFACVLAAAGCASHHEEPPPGPGMAEPPPQVAPTPRPVRPAEVRNLTGTRWHLERLDGRDVIGGSRASLVISREGRMGGNTSCNSMFGHVDIDGRKIAFGQMGSTKMYCGGDGVMQQERRYFDKLKQVSTWRIEGDRLYLTDRARKDVLVYEAE